MFSFVLSFCTVSKVNWSSLVSKMTKPVYNLSYTRVLSNMVRPTGFEPAAYRVGVCHSIQLSYGRVWSRGRLSPLRLIYYTIFFGNVKKKTAEKTKKIVKKVDKFWNLEYNSERRKQAVGESGLQPGSCRR